MPTLSVARRPMSEIALVSATHNSDQLPSGQDFLPPSRSDTEIIAHRELARLTLHSTLSDLSTCEARVVATTSALAVAQLFAADANLVGVVVHTSTGKVKLLSRREFHELLSRPYGIELFLRRPLTVLLESFRDPLILPANTPIKTAAEMALMRSRSCVYDPLLVHYGQDNYRILNVHLLLLAQIRMLRLSLAQINQQLDQARAHIVDLLPPPLDRGQITVAWQFLPCAQLGGDGLGYQYLDDSRFAFFLLDVSGHGIGAALLSYSLIKTLKERLWDVDFSQPAAVLAALNRIIRLRGSCGLFATIWYGVFARDTRCLRYAAAGHPAPLLIQQDGSLTPLRCRGMALGFLENAVFPESEIKLPTNAWLYLFSDGVFELNTADGSMLRKEEFHNLIAMRPPQPTPAGEVRRLEETLRLLSASGEFRDDFTLAVFNFN